VLLAASENGGFSLARLGNLDINEQVLIEDIDKPGVAYWMVAFYRLARERAKVYEMDFNWPTPEVARHNHVVVKEIARMTGRQFPSSSVNGNEWNRLKGIAEENLRSKQKR
jgi:hypothetical protein